MSRVAAVRLALPLAGLLCAAPATAQTCSQDLTCQFLTCRAPAFGTPQLLWGILEPTDAGQLPADRDNTDCDEFAPGGCYNVNEPHWSSIDVENGWIFTTIGFGWQIWDARTNPAQPVRTKVVNANQLPYWTGLGEEKLPLRDIDAPPGVDNLVAIAAVQQIGISFWDVSNKVQPRVLYQDHGSPNSKKAYAVYATTISGRNYAFGATTGAGLLAYDMTAAQSYNSCSENTPTISCPNVYLGKIGSRLNVNYVDGTGNFIADSSGTLTSGVEIWNVANPRSPQLVVSGLSGQFVHGVALWKKPGANNYYLAVRVVTGATTTEGRIYDMSCLAGGSCSAIGSLLWSLPMDGGGSEYFTTHSQRGSSDFLYFGSDNRCSGGLQREWLIDASDPAHAVDVTPPVGLIGGVQTGYWGWYYRGNPTGFNQVNPRSGKFYNDYFYRVAYTLFDVHHYNAAFNPSPAIAGVDGSPSPALVCQPVSFTASGVSGQQPRTLSWQVKDSGGATVATGGDVNPFVWATQPATPPDAYTATATVTNPLGSASAVSPPLNLQALPALAFTGPGGAPAFDPFSGTTVQLHVAAQGATEWNWDFGDGTTSGWMTSPSGGPNPSHTYLQTGSYDVRVSIRNCAQAAIESNPLTLDISSTGPLSVDQFQVQGCAFGFCVFDAGTVLTFGESVSGTPDFYDYDWNADGTYDETSATPVTTHVYGTAGTYHPVLRIRRGSESASLQHSQDITILPGTGPGDFIFDDDFETGALAAWSTSATDGGDLSVTSTSALTGTDGLAATINDTNDLYVEDDTPLAEPHYRVRFYFDPNAIPLSDNGFKIFAGFAENPLRRLLTVNFRSQGGVYQLRFKLHLDDDSWARSNWFSISDAAHAIEIEWVQSSGAGANDGALRVWIDGVAEAQLTGLDNDTRGIDYVRMGVVSAKAGQAGTIYFDDFKSRRQSYIGP
jgi:PKD domain